MLERKGGGRVEGKGRTETPSNTTITPLLHPYPSLPTPPHYYWYWLSNFKRHQEKFGEKPKTISTPDPPPINRRFPAFSCLSPTCRSHLPPPKYLRNIRTSVQSCLLLPHTSHTQKRNFRPRTYDKKSMNRTIGMLGKHLQSFVQYSQVRQELFSCNTCKF